MAEPDAAPECLLLSLPAELRNRVYEAYFEDLNVAVLRPRTTTEANGTAILRVNHQLRRETLPFYYCSATFRLDHKGHRDFSATDETFYRWLQRQRPGDLQRLRRLELKVRVPYIPPPKAGVTKDPSIALIGVDLNLPDPETSIVTLGYYSDCPLMIQPFVRKAVAKVPRVEKKPLVTEEVLWDIWEACYFLSRSDSRERRTWAEFTRAYELYQAKRSPQRWSEDVYYEMSQEAIHGSSWRLRATPAEDSAKASLYCI